MEIYKSKYLALTFLEEESLMEWTWFPTTLKMQEEEFQYESKNFLELALQYQPKNVMPDTREMMFLITPDLQEWIGQEIFARLAHSNLHKVAIIVSPDFYVQLSIEQVNDEAKEGAFITQYFDDKEKAKQWLREA